MAASRVPRKQRTEAYANIFLEAVRTAVVLPDHLTRTELRLWLLLVTVCEWGNVVILSQRQLSVYLGVTDGDLSRAMRTLLDERLILRERPERGRTWLYRLPTALVNRGPLSQIPWKREQDRQRMIAAVPNTKNTRTSTSNHDS